MLANGKISTVLEKHMHLLGSRWKSKASCYSTRTRRGFFYSILKTTPSIAKQDYNNRNKHFPIELWYSDMITACADVSGLISSGSSAFSPQVLTFHSCQLISSFSLQPFAIWLVKGIKARHVLKCFAWAWALATQAQQFKKKKKIPHPLLTEVPSIMG